MYVALYGRASSIVLGAALLAGCGGTSELSAGASPTSSRDIVQSGTRHAKQQDLIYASGGCGGTCILSYPQGQVVGAIPNSSNMGLGGDCSDSEGNVYISNDVQVLEFKHGGTSPITTFSLPQGNANGCAVDPMTGNLAVVFDFTGVAVFKKESSTPTVYSSLLDATYCGYDDAGNLFVDGISDTHGIAYGLSELPTGSSGFETLTVDQKVGLPGQVQWDGQYLTYESGSPGLFTISRLAISGSSATIVSQTTLKRVRNHLAESWIYKGSIIAAYSDRGPHARNIGIWKYPRGGAPTKRITAFGRYAKKGFGFSGVTISEAE